MPLIFGDMGLDLGQFPDLVPSRLRVAARELSAATPALDRLQRLHVVALFGGDEGPLVLLVAGLPALLLFGARPRRRPGVRMLNAGRERGVLWRLAGLEFGQPIRQPLDLSQQGADDRLGLGPEARQLLCREVE
jgi:hypothetical protein